MTDTKQKSEMLSASSDPSSARGVQADLSQVNLSDLQGIALQTMGQWVVAIADNIRNPVAGMRAALEVIRHQLEIQKDPERQAQFSCTIVQHALTMINERLLSLNEYVTELVDFAKVPQIYPQKTSIPRLVGNLIDEMQGHFAFPVQFTLVVDPQVQDLLVDGLRLKSALRALIVNGVEAASPLMHERGTPAIHLTVEFVQVVNAATMMRFAVEDNGPGFTEDAQRRCLEAFFSTKEAGTGLGLYLVQKYVMAHGGSVFIEAPMVLGGARVGVMLPVGRDQSSAERAVNKISEKKAP